MNAPLWFSNLVFWSAQVALLILAAAFLVRLLRIRQPRVLLVHWRALLLICLLLPFLQPWHRPPTLGAVSTAPIFLAPAIPASSPAPSHWHFPDLLLVAQILGVVILAGIVVRFAILLLGLFRLRQFRHASSPIPAHAESAAILERIRTLVGVQAEFRLSTQVDSPVTFGFSAPLILLPERFLRLDPQFQSAIACHESLHVRRRDWAHHLSEEILRVAFWFHPAILWLVSRIRLAREQVVDLEVVKLTQTRKPYLEALLEFTTSRSRIAAIPAPPFLVERQLVERVALMLKEVHMSRARLIASLSAIACLLAAAAVLAVSVFPLKAAPRPAPNPPQIASTPQTSWVAIKPVVAANTIWTDTVKKGSMAFVARGTGTLVPADNSGVLVSRVALSLPEEVERAVRPGQSAYLQFAKAEIKGHVSSTGYQDSYGNRWADITPDSPLPHGTVANASVEAFIEVGKLENILYIGRPAGPWVANANAMPLFKVIDNGKQAVRVEVSLGHSGMNTIQILSGLNEGDKVILSDMFPYNKFDRIQIKR